MADLFSEILNMSLTASLVIAFVLAARLLLRKAPKVYSYALWAVVLFRLLCPVSLSAPVSLLTVTDATVTAVAPQEERVEQGRATTVNYLPADRQQSASRPQTAVPSAAPVEKQKEASLDLSGAVALIWLAGAGVMVLYSLATYADLRRNLVGAMRWRDNAYLADHIDSPFVLGILRPRIYLPSGTPVKERRYILAHETHHIRRCDHIVKMLAYAALCIHWFNPLVWIAFIQAGKDMEMSCDEAVIKKLGEHIRADYSASLLRLATHRRLIAGTPLAFGEGDTKGRVLNMAKWKKPKVWVSILCIVLCIAVLAFCALNPEEEKSMKELTLHTGELGPCGVTVGHDLHFTIPGGIAHWLEDREDFTDAELKQLLDGQETRGNTLMFFAVGDEVFGGKQDHILPEGTDLTDPESWMPYMDLWEWDDPTLGHFGESSAYGDWELEFFTDVPPGTESETVQRKHYFFLSSFGHRVFDMWFDMTVADPAIVEEILDSAYVAGYASGGHYDLEAPATLRLGGFQLTVPENYGYIRKGDTQLELVKQRYWSENITLGGAVVRPLPEFALDGTNYIEWVKATGIPYDEQRDSFAVTDETPYGDLSASIDDLTNGKPTKDIIHYFYIQGDVVYDLWFDELQIDEKTQQKILDSIKLWDFGDVVTIVEENEAQTRRQALERCRSILEMVQSKDAYQIRTEQINGPGALNATASIDDLYHGENRLRICRIPESGGESFFGTLIWNGVQYECDSGWEWKEGSHWALPEPWLAVYQWNEEKVAYVDTLTEEDGTTVIMLRIDEPYPGEEAVSSYFVNFRFATDGSFQYLRTLVGGTTRMESIVTLDENMVLEQIQAEVNRAVGEEMGQAQLEQSAEELLRQCREILEAVQSGSCHLIVDQPSTGDPDSHWSTDHYYQHGGNWMTIRDVDPESVNIVDGEQYTLRMAFLVYDGVRYSNDGKWGKAYTDIQWTKTQDFNSFNDTLKPWLARFQWRDEVVRCYGATTTKDGEPRIVMLKISEPYPGQEDHTESYFVYFHFDENGSFRNVSIQADHFRGETMEYRRMTESIASLDDETAKAMIDTEYNRAIG